MADTLELLTRPRLNERKTRPGLLARLGITPSAVIDPTDPRAPGIDCSNWNTGISWPLVVNNDLAFAFVKSTESTGYMSPAWRSQWDNLGLLGIPRGAYHFWRGNMTGAAQAAWFLKNTSKGELPPVLDVEDADNVPLSLTTVQKLAFASNIRAWLDAVEVAWGQTPIIYSGAWWWNRLGTLSWANDYPGWFATYRPLDQMGPIIPLGWDHWDFWQWSSAGVISGFPDRVDLNVYRASRDQFRADFGLGGSIEARLATLEKEARAHGWNI